MEKKKRIFGIILGLLVVSVLIGAVMLSGNKDKNLDTTGNTDKVTASPTPTDEPSDITEPTPSEEPTEVTECPFEEINELPYKILRRERNESTTYFDILPLRELTDDEIIIIGKEAFKLYFEKYPIVNKMYFNTFSSEDAYEETLKPDYKRQPIPGHLSNIVISRTDFNHAVRFEKYAEVDNSNSFKFDLTEYNVVHAEKDNGHITLYVVISEATDGEILDTAKGLASIVKTINDGATSVEAYFYLSEDDYKSKANGWHYSEAYNSFLTTFKEFSY